MRETIEKLRDLWEKGIQDASTPEQFKRTGLTVLIGATFLQIEQNEEMKALLVKLVEKKSKKMTIIGQETSLSPKEQELLDSIEI